MVYYTSTGGQLKFDFELQPGADPSRIAMRFAAAWSLSVDKHDGSLTASHPGWGSLTLPRPIIYQPLADNSQSIVDGGYSLTDNVVGFWLGDYDAALPLVIDPLVFSTYFGGSDNDYSANLAVDSDGNVAITGYTLSSNYPTASAYEDSNSGNYDAIVSKFSAGVLDVSGRIGPGFRIQRRC